MPRSKVRPAAPLLAVVTGASSGLGEAAARRLAREPGAHVVVVARREDRLAELVASLPSAGSHVAADLTASDAPQRVAEHVASIAADLGLRGPNLLVNNAGAGFRARFARGGFANVQRTMAVNFDAVLRLTEALLPSLRAATPAAIVNVASTAGRVSRSGTGAYSASKAALLAWTDAVRMEEVLHGVHVGSVLPGFIPTEGFPQQELVDSRFGPHLLGTPEEVAEAICDVGLRGANERYVPRKYVGAAVARVVLPGVVQRATGSSVGSKMTTRTNSDE